MLDSDIPEQFDFDPTSYLDEIANGSQLCIGISQQTRLPSSGQGRVSLATSINVTDIVTGITSSEQLSGLRYSQKNGLYFDAEISPSQQARIGIDWDLQDCKFEYVNLDRANFG